MTTALVIVSNPLDETANWLVGETLLTLRARDPALRVVMHDVASAPFPPPPEPASGPRDNDPAGEVQAAARSLSDQLLAELETADTVVIGTPSCEFGITSSLDTWFEYVLRPNILFRHAEDHRSGLLGAGAR
jgi:FMN-dependent NADH-azoreductase